jgi:hypothetical protein
MLLFQNQFRLRQLPSAGSEEATLLESEKYRDYARDCIRLAEQMSAADRQTLLKIAEAWEMRAVEAEREEQKRKG